jgi:uncharacterized protein with von Willebrand factor type A (vWA) domain
MQTACIEEVGERAAEVIEQKLLEFCRLLRAYGIQVNAGRIIDIFRSLQAIDVFNGTFYTALEANVVSRAGDRERFRQLFLQFWSGPTWAMPSRPVCTSWGGCLCAIATSPRTSQNACWKLGLSA